ncbi:small RNA 2'-O-methyltransferase [Pelodytes ibericus]
MEKVVFSPRLFEQRRNFVLEYVQSYKPRKVADLGCNNCALMELLRHRIWIEELIGVDINEDIITRNRHKLKSLLCFNISPRERPLRVTLYHGSVTEKDPIMLECDLITCIEVIEHLIEEDVKKFKDTLFGYMAPRTIIISTPNSEFNVLFNSKQFRDSDHKFEWTRKEFQDWATEVAKCYNYMVEFTGVGTPPAHAQNVGFCSQIGVFTRNYTVTEEELSAKRNCEGVYKNIFEENYPSLHDENLLRNAVLGNALSHVKDWKQVLLHRLFPRWEADGDNCETTLHRREDEFIENKLKSYIESNPLYRAESNLKYDEGNNLMPFLKGSTVHIPIETVFCIPRIKELCGNIDTLKKMINEGAVLTDGKFILYEVDLENDYDITGIPYKFCDEDISEDIYDSPAPVTLQQDHFVVEENEIWV